jgi:hypothetical protein
MLANREVGQDLRETLPKVLSLAGQAAWALAGFAFYTAIIFYMGWRSGVIEGAPLGGPLCDQVDMRRGVP